MGYENYGHVVLPVGYGPSMRRTMLMLAAVLLAAVGTALVYVYVQGADSRALAGQKTVTVYLAGGDLPAGTKMTAGLLSAKPLPQDMQLSGAVRQPDGIVGKYLKVPVAQGQQLLDGMLQAKADGELGAGQAAVSIQVAEPDRVPALLKKGSYVLIFRRAGGKLNPVLPGPEKIFEIGGTNLPQSLITFVLPREDAKTLAEAQATGDPLVFVLTG